MSVEAMAVVLNHSEAKGTAKLVLLGIANHDGDGGAWPTIATLARYGNVDERSVQRAIEALVEHGELAVERNEGGLRDTRADRRPNRYTLLVRCPEDCDGTTNHRTNRPLPTGEEGSENGVTSTPPREENGATLAPPRGDTRVAHGVTPAPPEPSFNHPRTYARASAEDRQRVTAGAAETKALLDGMNRNRSRVSYGPDGKPSGASEARRRLRAAEEEESA